MGPSLVLGCRGQPSLAAPLSRLLPQPFSVFPAALHKIEKSMSAKKGGVSSRCQFKDENAEKRSKQEGGDIIKNSSKVAF